MSAVHLSKLDLNLLVLLHEMLETPSTVQVSRRLGVTQSAVSHGLARIREVIDDPLFVRVGRSLSPTKKAEALRDPISAWIRSTEALLRAADPLDLARIRRTFRISTTDAGELLALPGLVRRLAREAPHVTLEAGFTGDTIERAVQSGALDLGLGFMMREIDGVLAQTLFVDRMACLTADEKARGLSIAEYVRGRHVVVAPRGLPGNMVDRALAAEGHTRRVVARTPSFLVAAELVREGLMLTLPSRFADRIARDRGLYVIAAPIDLPPMPFRMVFAAVMRDDPAHRWLRAAVADAVRDEAAPPSPPAKKPRARLKDRAPGRATSGS